MYVQSILFKFALALRILGVGYFSNYIYNLRELNHKKFSDATRDSKCGYRFVVSTTGTYRRADQPWR